MHAHGKKKEELDRVINRDFWIPKWNSFVVSVASICSIIVLYSIWMSIT
jgi:hypothetical protein